MNAGVGLACLGGMAAFVVGPSSPAVRVSLDEKTMMIMDTFMDKFVDTWTAEIRGEKEGENGKGWSRGMRLKVDRCVHPLYAMSAGELSCVVY